MSPLRTPEWLHRRPVACGLVLAVIIEAITVFNRFVLGLSARDHPNIAKPFLGLRIHHGYWGLACLAAWGLAGLGPRGRTAGWRALLLAAGIGLVLSDAVHHFLVLWPITRSPAVP